MRAVLQKDNQFGPSGPQSGTILHLVEIRKIDGDYWAWCAYSKTGGQDEYDLILVKVDDIMSPNTENTETYLSTLP